MSKQVTLNLKALTTLVGELDSIKEQVTAHAGTQASRLKAAREAVIGTVKVQIENPSDFTVTAILDYAESLKAQADQALDEAVTEYLKGKADDSATSLTALRESFKAKAETAQAMQTMMSALGIDGAGDVTIPTLKGTGRVGTGKAAGNKTADYWTSKDSGKTKDSMAGSQNKFSSLAWYHGAAIGVPNCTGNKGKGCGSKELESFLKGKKVDITGKGWQYSAKDGFTIGMTPIETPEAEAPDAG